jgi:hypothetical protein
MPARSFEFNKEADCCFLDTSIRAICISIFSQILVLQLCLVILLNNTSNDDTFDKGFVCVSVNSASEMSLKLLQNFFLISHGKVNNISDTLLPVRLGAPTRAMSVQMDFQ